MAEEQNFDQPGDLNEIKNDVVQESKKSEEETLSESLNMPVNTVKILAYATGVIPMVGWLSSLLVLLLEKDVRVKLHAYHALVVFGGFDVLWLMVSQFSLLSPLGSIMFLVRFILWLYVIIKVNEGSDWMVPYVGPWAKKQVEIIKKGKKQ